MLTHMIRKELLNSRGKENCIFIENEDFDIDGVKNIIEQKQEKRNKTLFIPVSILENLNDDLKTFIQLSRLKSKENNFCF